MGEVLPCGVGIGRRTGKQRKRAKHHAGGACTAHPFLSSFTALPATIIMGTAGFPVALGFGALSTRRGASSSQGAELPLPAVRSWAWRRPQPRTACTRRAGDRIASFLTGKALATPPRPGILAEPPDIPLAGVSLSPAAVDRAVSALHKD